MSAKQSINNLKLGVFVFAGLLFLIFSLYMIGRNRNLFGSTFTLAARFNNINGLVAGNNVRYSGIDIGTVDRIELINDSSVRVTMLIDKSARGHIRKNALASIGTDGLMGNKLISIKSMPGPSEPVKDGDEILSRKPGEPLVSSLDAKGAPTIVQRTIIPPPMSRLGPAPDADRAAVQAQSPIAMKYDTVIDRESAYEILTGREAQAAKEKDALKRAETAEAEAARARKEASKAAATTRTQATTRASTARKSTRQTPAEAAQSTFMRTATRELTRFVFRGIFGNRKR